MTKEEFLTKTEAKLSELENDYLYNNYAKQLLAYKLRADISKTYELDYLWRKTLIAISSSCFLLDNDLTSKLALKSLYKIANILENIAEIPDNAEQFDVDFLRILSALCYDVSGYQANAYCIAKRIQDYTLSTEQDYNLDEDNFIIQLFLHALLKEVPAMRHSVRQRLREDNISEPFTVILEAFNSWADQILDLKETNALSSFRQAYSLYLKSGNIYISQLMLLFIIRIKMYGERSINLKLKSVIKDSSIWKKYIKLLSNDYFAVHGEIKGIEEKKSTFEFWTSQIRAIDDGLLSKDGSFVIQMPTSAGKTFIAELFILKHLINTQKKVLYISPFRALASEKVSELGKYFSYLGYKVSSSTGSYEYEPMFDSVFKDADIFVFTPEKTDLIFRMTPNFFEDIVAIVIDEGHIVGDLNYRAALAEMLLIKLKMKYPEIKTLFISAVMPAINADEYARWLANDKNNVLRSKLFSDSNINEEWEPTRKNIGYFKWVYSKNNVDGRIQFDNIATDDEISRKETPAFVPYFLRGNEYGINAVNDKAATAAVLGIKLSESGNTLIFCGQVQRIKTIVRRFKNIFEKNRSGITGFVPNKNKESYFFSKEWFGEGHWITNAILYGIGIHFGDMPEQVRSAVENDYKAQNLKIILCTNTIGQGVNFPIKNIVFYDITIGFNNNRQVFISHRDFWNIIGRAGRAEKETEGNIIFVVNSDVDFRNYTDFKDKSNIENSQSIIFFALQNMLEARLSENELDSLVLEITETFLLDMITEEVFENDAEFIENIIENSLFNVQVNNDADIAKVRVAFHKAISKIKENDENVEELEEFGKTGLNLGDNKTILAFINENIEAITGFLETQSIESFINIFLRLLSGKKIDALNDYKLNKLVNEDVCWDRYRTVILAWLHNKSIEEIKVIWSNDVKSDFDKFYTLLSKGLYYLFPWICNAIILLSAYVLKKDYSDLCETIRYIPIFMKYGLNNKIACTARMCGIKSRETAIRLANQSGKTSDKEFISWIVNLQKKEIDAMYLSPFEKENITDVVFSVAPNSNNNAPTHFSFEVVGTKYEDSWRKASLNIEKADSLELKRDNENEYDPFAIFVLRNGNAIGYVPREYAKYIATEMDLNNPCFIVEFVTARYIQSENYNVVSISVDLVYF